jgi:hypothetical protein
MLSGTTNAYSLRCRCIVGSIQCIVSGYHAVTVMMVFRALLCWRNCMRVQLYVRNLMVIKFESHRSDKIKSTSTALPVKPENYSPVFLATIHLGQKGSSLALRPGRQRDDGRHRNGRAVDMPRRHQMVCAHLRGNERADKNLSCSSSTTTIRPPRVYKPSLLTINNILKVDLKELRVVLHEYSRLGRAAISCAFFCSVSGPYFFRGPEKYHNQPNHRRSVASAARPSLVWKAFRCEEREREGGRVIQQFIGSGWMSPIFRERFACGAHASVRDPRHGLNTL